MVRTLVVALAASLLSACAREGTAARDPSDAPRFDAAGRPVQPGFYAPDFAAAWAVPSAWTAAEPAPPPIFASPEGGSRRLPSQAIPPGEACLAYLSRAGVAFERRNAVKGVETPVRVVGPIGGIALRAVAGMDMLCDCRLAVALSWSASELRSLGVRELRYSGAYVDRRTRAGRPSLHARGLALDVHAMRVGNDVVSVARSFERGLGDGCRPDAPVLNQAACRLRRLGLFKELLTPDDNYDHRDHFHLAIAPLPEAK